MPRRGQDKQEAQRIAAQIGVRLRRHRARLGWSQELVGERLGITPEAYGRIERGASLPSFPTLLAVCQALGIRPDELLLDADDELAEVDELEAHRRRVGQLVRQLDAVQLEALVPLLDRLTRERADDGR